MAQGVGQKAKQAGQASVEELARDYSVELIRWRAGMTPEAIVSEAFSLARAFKGESEKTKETNGEGQQTS